MEDEYDVESIVQAQVGRKRGNKKFWKYYVKWKDFGHEDNTWEPAESFGEGSTMIRKFWDSVYVDGRFWNDLSTFEKGETFTPNQEPTKERKRSQANVTRPPPSPSAMVKPAGESGTDRGVRNKRRARSPSMDHATSKRVRRRSADTSESSQSPSNATTSSSSGSSHDGLEPAPVLTSSRGQKPSSAQDCRPPGTWSAGHCRSTPTSDIQGKGSHSLFSLEEPSTNRPHAVAPVSGSSAPPIPAAALYDHNSGSTNEQDKGPRGLFTPEPPTDQPHAIMPSSAPPTPSHFAAALDDYNAGDAYEQDDGSQNLFTLEPPVNRPYAVTSVSGSSIPSYIAAALEDYDSGGVNEQDEGPQSLFTLDPPTNWPHVVTAVSESSPPPFLSHIAAALDDCDSGGANEQGEGSRILFASEPPTNRPHAIPLISGSLAPPTSSHILVLDDYNSGGPNEQDKGSQSLPTPEPSITETRTITPVLNNSASFLPPHLAGAALDNHDSGGASEQDECLGLRNLLAPEPSMNGPSVIAPVSKNSEPSIPISSRVAGAAPDNDDSGDANELDEGLGSRSLFTPEPPMNRPSTITLVSQSSASPDPSHVARAAPSGSGSSGADVQDEGLGSRSLSTLETPTNKRRAVKPAPNGSVPLHRARAAQPRVKMVDDYDLSGADGVAAAKAKFLQQKAGTSDASCVADPARVAALKAGPSRGIPARKSSLLTFSKGTPKVLKASHTRPAPRTPSQAAPQPSVALRGLDNRTSVEHTQTDDTTQEMSAHVPTAEELLQMTGYSADDAAALPDFDDEDVFEDTIVPQNNLDAQSSAIGASSQTTTSMPKIQNHCWNRSTIFGPLGLGADTLPSEVPSKPSPMRHPAFTLTLDYSVTVPVILKDIGSFGQDSPSLRTFILPSIRAPPGKFYKDEHALALLGTLSSGWSSARVCLSTDADVAQRQNFEKFISRLQICELFIAMSGTQVLAFCSSENRDISNRLGVTPHLLGLSGCVLVAHVVIENHSAFAEAAMQFDSSS